LRLNTDKNAQTQHTLKNMSTHKAQSTKQKHKCNRQITRASIIEMDSTFFLFDCTRTDTIHKERERTTQQKSQTKKA